MGSGSPPAPGPKPSAIPSHMLNGGSPLHLSTSSRDARERENLNSSIRSSFAAQRPAEFNELEPAAHRVSGDDGIGAGNSIRSPVAVR